MSWVSQITGIHVSPKHGIHIEPGKALATLATLGSMGALGPLAGALGAIPGAGAVMGAAKAVKAIPVVGKLAQGAGALRTLASANGGGGGAAPAPNGDSSAYDTYLSDLSTPASGATGDTGNAGSPGLLSRVVGGIVPRRQNGSIDWAKLAQVGLGAGAAVEGIQASNRQHAAQNQAMSLASADAATRAKLLASGIGRMTTAQAPDLSYLTDTGNPYSPRKRPVAVGSAATAGAY